MIQYVGFTSLNGDPTNSEKSGTMKNNYFEISLIVLLNRMLNEWERFQTHLRKRLLKTFIDFDSNGDGVLVLDEFRDLMRNLEGPNIPNERVIVLFNEALEMSSTNNYGGHEKDDPSKPINNSDPDKMSPQCFVEAVIRNRLGGYGNEFLDFGFIMNPPSASPPI